MPVSFPPPYFFWNRIENINPFFFIIAYYYVGTKNFLKRLPIPSHFLFNFYKLYPTYLHLFAMIKLHYDLIIRKNIYLAL